MTTQSSEDLQEAARLWMIRTRDPAFDDWKGLTEWLEGDPAHLAAYEAALGTDAWAGELFAHAPRAATPQIVPRRTRWLALGGAIAAVIAALASWTVLGPNHSLQEYATEVGEHRTVELEDGSHVVLNGATRITIDPEKPREIELAAGEALFTVEHDERNPFVVMVGKTRLVDAGTVFNVVRENGSLDVAVAEGSVVYEPGKNEIRLFAGDALSRSANGAEPVLRRASPHAIGAWQSGLLQYDDAPLDRIARDLGRNTGQTIRAAPGSDRMHFTGTLVVEGPAEQVLARAGALLGVTFTPDGDAWRMTPADDTIP